MSDKIFEFKPGAFGLTVDVLALFRKFWKKDETDPVKIVAQRFLQLFEDHGISLTQIPRVVPQLTMDKLRSTDSLLPSLTSDVLEAAAMLFGIRRSWLEGLDDSIYEPLFCYKQPRLFFEELATLKLPANGFAVRALTSTKNLDCQNSEPQLVALVLVEKVQDMGSEEVLRYRVYDDEWDWSHPTCRIQLKAMARLVFQVYSRPVPLHQVKQDLLQAIIDGQCVPRAALQGCLLTRPSLEDFALSVEESFHAKEIDELPAVLDYIHKHGLEQVAQRGFQPHVTDYITP